MKKHWSVTRALSCPENRMFNIYLCAYKCTRHLHFAFIFSGRARMHYLCIYPSHKIHKHLLCKFSCDVSHALSVGTTASPVPTLLCCGHAPLTSSSLAIANKFTSKVFICICLAASSEKDARRTHSQRPGLSKYHFRFN